MIGRCWLEGISLTDFMPFFLIPLIIIHCFLLGESSTDCDKEIEGDSDEEVVVTRSTERLLD